MTKQYMKKSEFVAVYIEPYLKQSKADNLAHWNFQIERAISSGDVSPTSANWKKEPRERFGEEKNRCEKGAPYLCLFPRYYSKSPTQAEKLDGRKNKVRLLREAKERIELINAERSGVAKWEAFSIEFRPNRGLGKFNIIDKTLSKEGQANFDYQEKGIKS